MKKVFSIISALIMVAVASLLISLSVIKKNVNLDLGQPETILVYNKSINPTKTGGYKTSDKEFNQILNSFNNITNLSLFDWLIHNASLDIMPSQDVNAVYTKYNSDFKNDFLALEFVFGGDNAQQDVILRIGEDTKVISFSAILFIIPENNEYGDIVAYYSLINGTSERENSYRTCDPIIFKGRAGEFINVVKNLNN